MWQAIIGGVLGGIGGAVTAAVTSSKQAQAYKKAANEVRAAAEKYSGKNAEQAVKASGENEARVYNNLNNFGNKGINQDSNNSKMNYLNASNALSTYDPSKGRDFGRSLKQTELNGKYAADTMKAQNALKQAGIEAGVQNQAIQSGMSALSDMASLYRDTKQSDKATSDERAKEGINNDSGLPESDIEDSLRQLETVQYQYKDPSIEGCDNEKHLSGFTAQSAEKTPLFRRAVKNGKDGIKRIDNWKLQEALVAGIAQLQREIDEIKKGGGK